jgi:undecaprenyl diphosphate synthase
MHAKGVRFKVVGDTSRFDSRIQALIRDAEANTAHNTTITLTIAANYGGRWDMLQATQAWQKANPSQSVATMTEADVEQHLGMAYAPNPDLLIRTGGESRISNFMLWQLAYTEMLFTDVYWPGFSTDELDQALVSYAHRERRFGSAGQLSVVNA